MSELHKFTHTGPVYWMQRFEYAIAHWSVKSAEDVLGSVLCAPGCFSLFRASAILKSGLLEKFRVQTSSAIDAIQCDQGKSIAIP